MDHGELSGIIASAREVEVIPQRMPEWAADFSRECNEHWLRHPGADPMGLHRAAVARWAGKVLAIQPGPTILIKE